MTTLTDAIGLLASAIAGDVKAIENGLVRVAAKVDQSVGALNTSVQTLSQKVDSVIDDAADASDGNTWSIDKTKAYIEARLVKVVEDIKASLPASAGPVDTQADFAATYRDAKVTTPAPAPDAPAPDVAPVPDAPAPDAPAPDVAPAPDAPAV
jgi:phage-related minor tail protein